MGHIFVDAVLRGTRKEKALKNVIVDTGATYTIMPTEVVEEVGAIKTPWRVELMLGNKKKVKAAVYVAQMEIKGRKGPMRIASFKDAVPAIGVDTLESLGLRADALKGKLEPVRGDYALYI
jgi:predicted aspartyl protease